MMLVRSIKESYEEHRKTYLSIINNNYTEAGKYTNKQLDQLETEYDLLGDPHLIYVDDHAVGTMLLTDSRKVSELRSLVPDIEQYTGMPWAEAARFSLDKKYRSRVLIRSVFNYVFEWVAENDLHCMAINAEPHLGLIYERMLKFRKLEGLEFEHPAYKGLVHNVYIKFDQE